MGKFVRSKSIHYGLSGFLKHVGSLIKLCRWYVPQKLFIADSVIAALKSPTIRKLSHIFICVSNIFPRIFRWFEIRFLWGLKEQHNITFFLRMFNSTKIPSNSVEPKECISSCYCSKRVTSELFSMLFSIKPLTFCGKLEFPHSFKWFSRNYTEPVVFRKTSTPGN